jgi:hypothetical protein
MKERSSSEKVCKQVCERGGHRLAQFNGKIVCAHCAMTYDEIRASGGTAKLSKVA